MENMKTSRLDIVEIETHRTGKIGNILLNAGKITHDDMEKILELQRQEWVFFGEAAVKLGILTQDDMSWALASQFSYPFLEAGANRFSEEVITIHQPFIPQVEEFRSIRSGLILSGAGERLKTISVISPDPGDGRTFIAANLAVVFAQLGSRTLLIDLNFRSPKVHELFDVKNNCGMSSLIIKRASIKQAVNPTAISDLYILPSGPIPPNPVELLGWADTRDIMASLKKDYDIVVMDTPCFNNTSDARLIGGFSDCAVLLVLKGKTSRESFGNVKKHLDNASVKIIGTIVNEIKEKKRGKR